jgi:Uma2 family endonuclease
MLHHLNGLHGSPSMVCEILSHSTERTDRQRKLRVYEQAGVRHYWLFDPERPVKVEELILDENGRYREQAVAEAPGLWSPLAFPGWTLDLGALEARIYRPGDPDTEESVPAS